MNNWKLNSVRVGVVNQIENILTGSAAVVNKYFSQADVLVLLQSWRVSSFEQVSGALCIFLSWLWPVSKSLQQSSKNTRLCAKEGVMNIFVKFVKKILWFMYFMGKIWEFQHCVYINNSITRVTLECNQGWVVLSWLTISCYIWQLCL